MYRGWGEFNDRLERMIAPLDADQLSLQAAPELWSVRILASHIVGARAWWFNWWMEEGGTELADLLDYDEGEESKTRDALAIVGQLRCTWSILESRLEAWTDADLAKEFQRREPNAAGERPWRSRQWIIWHLVEHDLSHGGEISLTLGMHGHAGLDL